MQFMQRLISHRSRHKSFPDIELNVGYHDPISIVAFSVTNIGGIAASQNRCRVRN